MNYKCKCISCNLTEYYKNKRENNTKPCNCTNNTVDNTTTLKDNQLFSVDSGKKSRNYRITLSDPGTNDGYSLSFSKEIAIFDFANLLSDFFGVNLDINYDEDTDSTTIANSPIFNSLDEFIESLENDNYEF